MDNFDITNRSSFLKLQVMESLRSVPDPELHISIIDLGLVYDILIEENEKTIEVTMTLSSRHCPVGEAILATVKNCLEKDFPAYRIGVVLTWEPEWNYDKITEEGLRLLQG